MNQKRQDMLAEVLEAVAQALASEGTFTEQIAVQIEQQFRAKYGGERVGIWKTTTGQVGRPPRQPYDPAAAFADGASAAPTTVVTKKHGISRATLYRLMKRGPTDAQE